MTEPTKADKTRSGRSPAFVYSGTSMVLVLVIAALTITASQTPPPAIAELAPSAVQQIKDPPANQASSVGAADGGGGFGEPAATTTTTLAADAPPPIVAPRQRLCVQDPTGRTAPRQTEDPQSPPCVALWTGKDNGGSTWKGITADEIRIALPTDSGLTRGQKDVEAFLNKRFEFYGRKLKLIPVKVAPNFGPVAEISASADKVEAENVFASLNFSIQSGNETIYYDSLAKKGIISFASSFVGTPSTTRKHMKDKSPYQWSFFPTVDAIFENYAEFVCSQLAGKPPAYAAPPESAAAKRKFGILVTTKVNASERLQYKLLTDATLAKCGEKWVVREMDVPEQGPYGNQDGNSVMIQFKDEGVTTIMCMCGYAFLRNGLMANGPGQSFYPEYLIHNFGSQDTDYGGQAWQGETTQRDHVIGLRSWNKALPREQSFHYRAKREVDPSLPPEQANHDVTYMNLLMLASGIQGAGPNLTPQSFAEALHSMEFPNPGCGGPPFFQACIDMRDGSFTAINDFTPVWWNSQARSVEMDPAYDPKPERRNGYGGFCYVNRGARFGSPNEWQSAQLTFRTGSCY